MIYVYIFGIRNDLVLGDLVKSESINNCIGFYFKEHNY